MPSKTRLELRDLVRQQTQMEDDELPNPLVDMYLNDALDQTVALEEQWPFYENQWSLTSIGGQIAYPRDATIGSVSAILDTTDATPFVLTYMPHHEAELYFGDGGDSEEIPSYWSEWGGNIHLWDTPVAGRTYTIRGYRRSNWGAGDNAVCDADDRLHIPILWAAVALAYASQEDSEVEAVYMQRWLNATQRAQSQIMGLTTRRPLTLSKGTYGPKVTRAVWDL